MQNYACPRCHGPLDPGYRFCKTCGLDLANPQPVFPPAQPAASKEKTALLALLILMGSNYAIRLLFFVWHHAFHGSYRISGWVSSSYSVLYILALLVFGIVIKEKRAKIFIWIFFGLELLQFIYDKFIYEPLPEIYYQF